MGKLVLITLLLFSITAIYSEANVGGKDSNCCQPDHQTAAVKDR